MARTAASVPSGSLCMASRTEYSSSPTRLSVRTGGRGSGLRARGGSAEPSAAAPNVFMKSRRLIIVRSSLVTKRESTLAEASTDPGRKPGVKEKALAGIAQSLSDPVQRRRDPPADRPECGVVGRRVSLALEQGHLQQRQRVHVRVPQADRRLQHGIV